MAIILKLRWRCMAFPPQPSDSLILVSWPCPEGHIPIFSAIQVYLSRTFHLAVDVCRADIEAYDAANLGNNC